MNLMTSDLENFPEHPETYDLSMSIVVRSRIRVQVCQLFEVHLTMWQNLSRKVPDVKAARRSQQPLGFRRA
jgi:hypothetical protein